MKAIVCEADLGDAVYDGIQNCRICGQDDIKLEIIDSDDLFMKHVSKGTCQECGTMYYIMNVSNVEDRQNPKWLLSIAIRTIIAMQVANVDDRQIKIYRLASLFYLINDDIDSMLSLSHESVKYAIEKNKRENVE